jgi:hypothetical protein
MGSLEVTGDWATLYDLSPQELADLGPALLCFSQLADVTTWLAANDPTTR